MATLKNALQTSRINWGNTVLWDIMISPSPKAPFDSWIPVHSVEDKTAIINTKSFEIYNTQFEIPVGTGLKTIQIEFYDDYKNTMLHFFEDWINNDILHLNDNEKRFMVGTLDEIVKKVTIERLDPQLNTIEEYNYYVYPKGEISYKGNSDYGIPTYSIELVKVATLGTNIVTDIDKTLLKAKSIIGNITSLFG